MEIFQADQIAEEIYAILVKHNLTVIDAERVLEHTKSSFKYARLSPNESPIFEEGRVTITQSLSVDERIESKIKKAMLIALDNHAKNLF